MFRRIISGLLTSLVTIVGALVVPQRLTAQQAPEPGVRVAAVAGAVFESRGQELNDCSREFWKFGLAVETGSTMVLKFDGSVFMAIRNGCVGGAREIVTPAGPVVTRVGGRELTGPRLGLGVGRRIRLAGARTYVGIQAGTLSASNGRWEDEVTGNLQPWFGFETSVDLLDGRVGLGIMQWWNRVGFQDMAVPESNPFNYSVPDHLASNRWAPVTEVSMRVRLFGMH